MSYTKANLMNDEKIIYMGKLHWIVFLKPLLMTTLLLLLSVGVSGKAVLIAFALMLITLAVTYITYTSSEFGLTDKRVIIKVGFIKRTSVELFLTKAQSLNVNQGILGRMFDYGTLGITGTGGGNVPLEMVAAPLEFRKNAQELISAAHT